MVAGIWLLPLDSADAFTARRARREHARAAAAGVALVAVLCWPSGVGAQGVSTPLNGTVADSATGRPIGGVTVTARDAQSVVLATLQTNTAGWFSFAAPKEGVYSFELRKIGYRPLQSGPVTIADGPSITLAIRMRPAVNALDTVVTKGDAQADLFGLTPGRELYRRHVLETKGQFVSGLELQQSRLKVSEYLGTLPGIRLTQAIPTSRQIGRDTFPYPLPITPNIPGSNHLSLISTSEGTLPVWTGRSFFCSGFAYSPIAHQHR